VTALYSASLLASLVYPSFNFVEVFLYHFLLSRVLDLYSFFYEADLEAEHPLFLAKSSYLLFALAALFLVSVALNKVALGLSLFIIFLFFNGFFF
jgi:hypothetical protein